MKKLSIPFGGSEWRKQIEKLRSKRINPTLEEWVKFIEKVVIPEEIRNHHV